MICDTGNVRSTGGLSKSDIFNQIVADMIGRPVSRCKIEESTAAGAWINAAVSLNFYGSRMDAFQAFSQKARVDTFTPQPNTAALYKKLLCTRKILEKSLPNKALEQYRSEI